MFETFFTEARLSPISETLMELHRLFLTASIVSLLSEFGYVCLFVDAWTNDVSFGKWYGYWKFVWESCCCMDTCLSATSRIAPPKRTLHATFYSWTNIFMLPTALWKYLAWCMQLLGTAPSYAMSTLGDRKKRSCQWQRCSSGTTSREVPFLGEMVTLSNNWCLDVLQKLFIAFYLQVFVEGVPQPCAANSDAVKTAILGTALGCTQIR